ncbi:hypothetical protein ACWD2L_05820 [Streptomyces sp. NPDC002754]
MTVKQLMAEMDSREYARWIAFEMTNGPIGGVASQQEVLSGVHEQLQLIAYLISQANFTNEDKPEGPVPRPQRFPRPTDPRSDDAPDMELDFSEEWIPPSESSCPPDCRCNGGDRKPTLHF